MQYFFDFKGVCASSRTACTSSSINQSHVILVKGVPYELTYGLLE